ncbi:MAG: hypothetical protein JNM52_04830 [Betaproteobacteria bacterium]|nr:hypothetical protein [Betaproteobacteria bacterium]
MAKGTLGNDYFIPTAVLPKKFLLIYQAYTALRHFFDAWHLGEITISRSALKHIVTAASA